MTYLWLYYLYANEDVPGKKMEMKMNFEEAEFSMKC